MDQTTTQAEARPEAPRYCPRCLGEASPDRSLCEACGETLHEQGYCPICERFWKIDQGRTCPKHDVELIDQPPPSKPFSSPEDWASLVTVATFAHPNQANGPRIRLEAEGIPTFLDGERIAGNTLYQVATGGVRLQVPESLASAARILIDQTWTPPTEPDDDLEDAFEDLAPEPGRRRRAVMKLAIWVILLGPVVTFLFALIADLLRAVGP